MTNQTVLNHHIDVFHYNAPVFIAAANKNGRGNSLAGGALRGYFYTRELRFI